MAGIRALKFTQAIPFGTACAALSLMLSGCTSNPPDPGTALPPIPEQFSTPTGSYQRPERWWEDFGDAQLNQFMEEALLRNPTIQQAMARVRIAEAQARMAGADRWPQLALRGGPTRQGGPAPALPGLAGSRVISNNISVILAASWELDVWGRIASMSAAARAEHLASEEQLRAVRQSIAAGVVRMYLQIVHDQAQVEFSAHTTATLAETSRQVNNRVRAGVTSPADGQLALASLESARAGLEMRQQSLAASLRQLETLLGTYPAGRVKTAHVLPELPAPPAAGVPSELLERRPDVRAAGLALQATGLRLRAAERSFLPSLSLTGAAGYSGSALSDLFNASQLVWSIAGTVLQPVFLGGRLVAQVDMARGAQDVAIQAYANTALQALAEAETALASGSILARQTKALHATADAAEQAQRIAHNRYMQGITPFLNVLEGQRRALDARSAEISSRHAEFVNRIALILALGGGFETEAQPVAIAPARPAAMAAKDTTP